MNELTQAVLESEPVLPMDVVGWGALILGLLVTIVWLVYLYR
ncbi:hypothetical protein SAMN05444422_101780 [Halobiforma haloterrestris]|uniref:Uncharacterized protein n=2 Tax=Natronobacterium TaxID=2256 RepID=M0LUI7_NATLA|nr:MULTISPECIES: hypothetical protein [Halobiforma]EMA36019.1 hypothetical protein C445_04158 [Halobiforma lacisalsi AJ5]SFB75775.1 hypothetical protein SAMN05444422_101780 [Halobiforma haloterrestris]